jgi:hypothetical protein
MATTNRDEILSGRITESGMGITKRAYDALHGFRNDERHALVIRAEAAARAYGLGVVNAEAVRLALATFYTDQFDR